MGVVYMDLGMDEEAVRHLEKAVQLLPYDYQSLNNLGIVYGRLDQPEKALRMLMTAMSLSPDSDTVKINLSLYYLKQKEYKKSEEILRYLISRNPNNGQLYYRLGTVCKEAGDYEGAVRELNRCQELAPHIINSYEELGNIYLSRLRDVEKAKTSYRKGIANVPKAGARIEQLRWMIQDLER
jgi:tetratricopeptide (TPR) repeat protein